MADDTISAENLPWSRQEWFEEAAAWIQEQLIYLHYTITSDIKQVHASPTSCVLSVATTSGDIYFKACAPLFKYELLLTQMISQLLPTYTIRVLNMDNERSWLLMEDAGLSLRKLTLEKRDLKHWQDALSLFAHFQIESIPYVITHIEEYAKAEFRDVTPYWLRLFLHNGEEFEEDTP